MAKLTAAEAANKWRSRMSVASEEMRRGADRVSESPGAKAARSQEKMLTNLIESVRSGRWAKALQSMSLEDWRRAYKEKGVARIQQGVDGAAGKVEEQFESLFAHIDRGKAELARMPNNSLEDNIARNAFWIRHMAKHKSG